MLSRNEVAIMKWQSRHVCCIRQSRKPGSGGSREPQVLSAQSLINGAISEKKALDEI
jgi:hypothetical protein